MRKLLTIVALLTAMTAQAQWRVGVVGGADYNVYRMDQQYMTDFKVDGRWGATLGVTGQYDVNEWLGVRAELDWTQKNYRRSRVVYSDIDYKYTNNYLQLPLMASFSFGAERLRGFCNVGVYGGYWLSSHRKGTDINFFDNDKVISFDEKVDFYDKCDQRWDCGLVGGVGIEYRLAEHWAAQAEARYYYSTTSATKQYMRIADYRYNSTTALQLAINYIF
jgi:opacity protein-like surface antigen